jgi:hypothetical protein
MLYSSRLRNFLLMIFEERDIRKDPLSLQELLEHEFLTSFVEANFELENKIPWYHTDQGLESNECLLEGNSQSDELKSSDGWDSDDE